MKAHTYVHGGQGCAYRDDKSQCGRSYDSPLHRDVDRGPDGATGSGEDKMRLEQTLNDWWLEMAHQEIERTVPKAVEYGATDLRDIGRVLAECMGRRVEDEEAAEMGIFFYMQGKMARWMDAVKRGDRPSDDTLFDIGVYVRMAQRVRAVGGWPVGTDEEG